MPKDRWSLQALSCFKGCDSLVEKAHACHGRIWTILLLRSFLLIRFYTLCGGINDTTIAWWVWKPPRRVNPVSLPEASPAQASLMGSSDLLLWVGSGIRPSPVMVSCPESVSPRDQTLPAPDAGLVSPPKYSLRSSVRLPEGLHVSSCFLLPAPFLGQERK